MRKLPMALVAGLCLAFVMQSTQAVNGSSKPGSMKLFISGHSLTDLPLPDFLSRIAGSLSNSLQWNRQYMVGSTLEMRTRGVPRDPADAWAGYRRGIDRAGTPIDALAELRADHRYDALLVTEVNGLLYALFNYDTVRLLRHYHERFIASAPKGRTVFYQPWHSIDNLTDPSAWIALERAASPVWQCITTRINVSLAAEGRTDRIEAFPAGLFLAELVSQGIPGGGDPVATLFSDDVHLTPLGHYYIALLAYGWLFERSPEGGWVPDGADPGSAGALQRLAWSQVTRYRAENRPLDLAQCRSALTQGLIARGWRYAYARMKQSLGLPRALVRCVRNWAVQQWQMRRTDIRNPLYFDPSEDRNYWLGEP